MKLFFQKNVNKGVLTYFKDVFLAGRLKSCPAFFVVGLRPYFLQKIFRNSSAMAIGMPIVRIVVTIKNGVNVMVPAWIEVCTMRAQPQMMNICKRYIQ